MSHHVLVLGGHGKIAQLLTPLLLQRAWTVTSVIRSQDQVPDIEALAPDANARKNLHVLVHSLEDLVQSQAAAQQLLDQVRPDYVVWSAGAGGRGGPERTLAIDRDAATHIIDASGASSFVTRFLMVSYISSRRARPAWWDDDSWASAQHVNSKVLPTYYQAKIAADEALYRAAKRRGTSFAGINLRPGTLSDEPAGSIELGRTKGSNGKVSRASVARAADLLLAHPDTRTAWIDLLTGSEDAEAAVDRVVREHVDAVEGEPVTKEKGE
ncbi:NAD dependent epimerase/dehydratase family protein [Sporothrix brasiliensis 5110]|uniref:NAD dependent epimerase/dehydratase family protein n=1 Tax=Sporothrix brasiliensis 5110 TaxID=1398154 RepID=A0A0C2IGE0_9PEZI|nr:NAD dependent epimerase/dehydratase family protein [Sporothrix brasiliensis 5110]KIH88256.1 NAD dependent epimerase/dehydratase family protein [Sporothrix brasiliensis 5110]